MKEAQQKRIQLRAKFLTLSIHHPQKENIRNAIISLEIFIAQKK